MESSELFLYFLILITITLIGVMVFLARKAQKSARISGSLKFTLYEITQPQEEIKDKEKSFKEIVSVMEQFYAGMSSIKEGGIKAWFSGPAHFALELALPHVGEETTFFAAVPKKHTRLFEKQIQAFFPHARLEIKHNDYNIFNPEGAHTAARVTLANRQFLPIRTYHKLDADPLEVIANAFSKLEITGEGAALQIILSPDEGGFIKQVKSILKNYKKTGTLKAASNGSSKIIKEVVFGTSGKQKGAEKDAPQFDEETAKLLEEKAGRMIFKANIRLVASAKTKEEADSILRELSGAFAQFSEAGSNEIKITPLSGKALEKSLYNFIMRIFDENNAIYLNTSELTSIYHFPIGFVSAPKLKYLKAKDAPPPANLPSEGVMLGKNVYRGEEREVRMLKDDRRRHMYIIGQTGTGKSYFMQNLIRQDIEAGEGICVIDPHGEMADNVLGWVPKERVDDVIYFDPGNTERPMGLNMLEYDTARPEQKTLIVNELLEIFQKLFADMPEGLGPMFQLYFRNAAMLVMEDPQSGNTLLEIGRVLAEQEFRNLKLSRSKNPVINSFWREVAEKAGGEAALANMVPYITSKFDAFTTNEIMRPIIMQEKSAFNFRQIMDDGKIFVVNLSKGKLGDLNAYLLGLIIVGRLSIAALSRGDVPEESRRDFYLYIDEFQNVTTKSIATILSEARKYRLDMTIAHQFIAQLSEEIKDAVFGNIGSMASFRVGPEDAEFLEKQFAPVFDARDLMNVENRNAFLKLLINGQVSRPFNIKTVAVPKSDYAVAKAIRELSAMKYGRPRDEVEAEIAKKYQR